MADLQRGDVVVVDLDPVKGAEKMDVRPCVIVQNNVGNKHSPLVIIVPLTDASQETRPYPVNVHIQTPEGGLAMDSVAECGQIRTIDKSRILERWQSLSSYTMTKIDKALRISLDLGS